MRHVGVLSSSSFVQRQSTSLPRCMSSVLSRVVKGDREGNDDRVDAFVLVSECTTLATVTNALVSSSLTGACRLPSEEEEEEEEVLLIA